MKSSETLLTVLTTKSEYSFGMMATFLLLTLLVVTINQSETVSQGSFIRVAPSSLQQISLPNKVEHIEQRVTGRDLLAKGEVIARIKDINGHHISDIKAQIPGHFVKNPDCCKDKKDKILGYLVKKNKNKVIFFQSIDSRNINLQAGDKVVIQSDEMTFNGEVVMTYGSGSSSIKSTYGVSFDKRPDYHALVYEGPLIIHKIKPVKRLVDRLFKEFYMIRL